MKNVIHQIDSQNEWVLLPASFMAKFELVFVLTMENDIFRGFILKPTERAQVLLKNGTSFFCIFGIGNFYVTITRNFEYF